MTKFDSPSINLSMEISFSNLRSKEIVNLFDGKRLGRAVDVVFDSESAKVQGIIVPGEKKVFRKQEDIFVPIDLIRKIGEDVILVKLSPNDPKPEKKTQKEDEIYARYKRVPPKE